MTWTVDVTGHLDNPADEAAVIDAFKTLVANEPSVLSAVFSGFSGSQDLMPTTPDPTPAETPAPEASPAEAPAPDPAPETSPADTPEGGHWEHLGVVGGGRSVWVKDE